MNGAYRELPSGYAELEKIDLAKNKKQASTVTLLSLGLMVVMIGLGLLLAPFGRTFFTGEVVQRIIKLLVTGAGIVAYLIGHEAVHGIVMWRVSRVKPRFGLTLMYAYAGSDALFAKAPYIIIALAPVALWGVVFAALAALVPDDWFWVVYFLQIMNVSGSAGDFYVAARISRMPADVLVRDTGTSMTVFHQAEAQAM